VASNFDPFVAQVTIRKPSDEIKHNGSVHDANREKQGDWQNGKKYFGQLLSQRHTEFPDRAQP
jgi:hypothetical protein